MIGILDWGIGGLGCYRALRELDPAVRVVYFSDAGFAPYGKVATNVLAARVRQVATHLCARGVTQLAVACNAASSVLPQLGVTTATGMLETSAGAVQVAGIVAQGLALCALTSFQHLGVIGGARAVRSNAYGRPLRAAGLQVQQRIAQPLSAFVEAGELDSPALRRELVRILAPLARVDALLLACTHYPALTPLLRELLPSAKLLDPAPLLAGHVHTSWRPARAARSAHDLRHDVFITTGSVQTMRIAARRAWKLELGTVTTPVTRLDPKRV